MRRIIFMLVLSAGLLAVACGGGATDPTATALLTPTSTPTEVQDVTFTELFSSPDQYNGDILLEGFYFQGFETTVLSERMEASGRAEGHLWPQGQMIWIEGSLPKEASGPLSVMANSVSREGLSMGIDMDTGEASLLRSSPQR